MTDIFERKCPKCSKPHDNIPFHFCKECDKPLQDEYNKLLDGFGVLHD